MAADHVNRARLWVTLPSAFIVLFAAIPFLSLVLEYSRALDFNVFGTSVYSQILALALTNSLVQGALGTIFSVAAGLPIGLFLGLHEFRGKRILRSLIILPFFLPSIVVVSGFLDAFHLSFHVPFLSSGLTGITAVNAFFNAPLIAMLTSAALESSDRGLVEAAMCLGAGPLRRFSSIWGREAMKATAAGSVLTFLYSFAGFTAPLIIGGPSYFTMEAYIYYLVRIIGALPAAASLAALEFTILLIPVLAYSFMLRNRPIAAGASPVERRIRGPLSLAGLCFSLLWIAFDFLVLSSIPISLFSRTPVAFLQLFGSRVFDVMGITTQSTVLNSFFYGFVTTVAVSSMALLWVSSKRMVSHGSGADWVQFVPLVISPVILAFSLSTAFSSTYSANLVWILIILSQSVVTIPVVFRVVEAGFAPVPLHLSEAARLLGGSALFEVELPLVAQSFGTALVFGFAMSLGEFTATNFLATPAYIPLSVEIYDLQNARLFALSNAAAVLLLLISAVSFYVIQRTGERFVAFR